MSICDNNVIEAIGLTKTFGQTKAVQNLSLRVNRAEIYGFSGLNGAGKTTTIRMLLGMIRPSGGELTLWGNRVTPDLNDIWNRVGYMVETPHHYPDLTVRENLEVVCRWRRLRDKEAIGTVMNQLNLTKYADRLAKHLSMGNCQRLGLARALIHQPDLLILDEPSNGLDPAGIVEIRNLLNDLSRNKGVTIFISSHILGEVARLASRIGFIHEGVLIKEIKTGDIAGQTQKRLLVKANNIDSASLILENAGIKAFLDSNRSLVITDENLVLHPDDIAILLVNAGCPPVELRVEQNELESYFLQLVGAEVLKA